MNIFESAVKQLTVWYVGALLLVCLLFSIPTYTIAAARLQYSARRQTEIIQEFNGTIISSLPPRLSTLRDQQLARDRRQLLQNLVLANVIILALGAYGSYQFAKRTLKPIEEAHDAQARFTADASHELRTPLATMQAEIEVALRDKRLTGLQAQQVLTSNLEEIARLRTLSDQLLSLARRDSKPLAKGRVAISKLLQEEIARVKKQHPDATVEATITPKLSLQGDEKLLRQLITILADNAIRYAGDQPASLAFNLVARQDTVILTVSDHGIGIKATELPHVFDRFYRGSNAAKHRASGHGLGLALAKHIVEAHGGSITAASQPGSTVFTVTLAS